MKEPIFNNDILEAAFRQAVIENFECELTEIEKEPDIAVSERQQQRMATLLAKKRHERTTTVFIWAKKFAAVAASLFIVLSCALLTVPEVRASVGHTIIGWFAEFAQFGQDGSDETNPTDWNPAYLPEGFEEMSNAQIGEITTIRYTNSDGDIIEFKYVTSDNSLSTNNEGVEYGQSPNNGIVYHTFTARSDDFKSSVVWDSEGYLFTVSGYLPMEQLLEIAWSVG